MTQQNCIYTERSIKHRENRQSWLDFAPKDDPNSLAMIIPGLNEKPEAFTQIANLLAAQGVYTRIVVLEGHRTDETWAKNLKAKDWLDDLKYAYQDLTKNYPNLEIANISFSLGAPLTLVFLKENPEAKFKETIFLAPAITPKRKSILVKLLTQMNFFGFSLPSLAPANYRVHDHTSLSAYAALFKLIKACQTIGQEKNISQSHVQIFLRPDDELISLENLKFWLQENDLNWELYILDNKPLDSDLPAHLLSDENNFGKEAWQNMKITLANLSQSLRKK